MPNTSATEERRLEFEVACLEGHPRQQEALQAISAQVAELAALLDGNLILVARVYAAIGSVLYDEQEKKARQGAYDEIFAAQLLSAAFNVRDELSALKSQESAPLAPERPETAWQFATRFRRRPENHAIHRLQHGEDVGDTGTLRSDHLPSDIERHADELTRIEMSFEAEIARAGRNAWLTRAEWEAQVAAADREPRADPVLFDPHLYSGYIWKTRARSWIAICMRRLEPEGVHRLEAAVGKLPPRLRVLMREEVDGLAERLEKLRTKILTGFPEGLTQATTRSVLVELGLESYGVAPKTWLDELADRGRLRKDATRRPQTYYIVDGAWPA